MGWKHNAFAVMQYSQQTERPHNLQLRMSSSYSCMSLLRCSMLIVYSHRIKCQLQKSFTFKTNMERKIFVRASGNSCKTNNKYVEVKTLLCWTKDTAQKIASKTLKQENFFGCKLISIYKFYCCWQQCNPASNQDLWVRNFTLKDKKRKAFFMIVFIFNLCTLHLFS